MFKVPNFSREVKDDARSVRRVSRKKESRQAWTYKERLLIFLVFLGTIFFSLYFWYQGMGFDFKIDSFFEQRVILEK